MNKKHVLMTSAMTIALTVLITATGTYALFNAKKTISTNKFMAGTLDLDVASADNINQAIMIDNIGELGESGGTRSWKIKNTGTMPGKLLFNLSNVNNYENGCNDPEIEAESSCTSNEIGELGKAINIVASMNGKDIATSTLENGNGFTYNQSPILQPNEQVDFSVRWQAGDYGNEVQSDSVGFDMVFRLEQQ